MKKEKPIIDEIASVGNDPAYAGYLTGRLDNPDIIVSKVRADKAIEIYDEILRDPHVYSQMQTRALSVTSKEYEVIPASEDKQDIKIAELAKQVLDNFTYDKACESLIFGEVKGYSVGEIMWEYSEGSVWVKEIKHRAQRRFVFTPQGELRLLTVSHLLEGEEVPPNKFHVITWGPEAETPYGNPLGNKLYWPWWFKKHGIKWWVIFQEKFAMPTPVGKYPPGTLKTKQQELLDAISAIQKDSGLVIPENMIIEFMEATRSGKANYQSFPEFFDAQMSKAILGQTLTSDSGEKGARSLGEVHERVMDNIVKAVADNLCAYQNAQLIKWIVDYNFPGVKKYPKVWRRVEKEQDLKALADRDEILINIIGVPVAKKYIYDTYGIPEPQEGEDVIEGRRQKAENSRGLPGQAQKEFSGKCPHCFAGEAEENDSIDNLTDRLLNEADLSDMIAPVKELLNRSSTLDEFKDKLLEIYSDMDATKLGNLMRQAFTAAELTGRFESGNL